MISLGGIIGAGIFVGSSAAIATAGPAVLVSYALNRRFTFKVASPTDSLEKSSQ